jgi:hypothetical protein
MAVVRATRLVHFSAAHRLYRSDWSNERNAEVFGDCSNPNWHGHNYELEVTVEPARTASRRPASRPAPICSPARPSSRPGPSSSWKERLSETDDLNRPRTSHHGFGIVQMMTVVSVLPEAMNFVRQRGYLALSSTFHS